MAGLNRSAATKVAILGRLESCESPDGQAVPTRFLVLGRGLCGQGQMPALEIRSLRNQPDVVEVEDPAELAATEQGLEPEPEAESEMEEIVAPRPALQVSAHGSGVEGVVPFDEALDTAWISKAPSSTL